jgi:diguanylate cyclase (GGDEF)-like protein
MMRRRSQARNANGAYDLRLAPHYVILCLLAAEAPMLSIHPAELQRMHDELQEATRKHAEWHRHLVSSLVCRLPVDPEDLRPDAHEACGFGRWFCHEAQRDLKGRPQFASIEVEHAQLHELAAGVLREMTDRQAISRESFDRFMECSIRLRREFDSLRHDIAAALRSRDTLTGTYPRSEILPALHEAHELVLRGVQAACIAFMDLDHFKGVNDTYGHGLGDEVLARAARCVIDHLRVYDKAFRYGGDEFLLLLPGTHPQEAWNLVERIRQALSEKRLAVTPDGHPVRLTASFGVTSLEPYLSVEECIGRADKALLLAKAAGRDRVVCWDPASQAGTTSESEFSECPARRGSAVR